MTKILFGVFAVGLVVAVVGAAVWNAGPVESGAALLGLAIGLAGAVGLDRVARGGASA